jgi:hypothetical protein
VHTFFRSRTRAQMLATASPFNTPGYRRVTDRSLCPSPRAIEPNDSPLRHRLQTSSCSGADNPQVLIIASVERLPVTEVLR